LPTCFQALRRLGCNIPVFVAVTLTNVRGLEMAVAGERSGLEQKYPIDTDTLVLPETEVEDFSAPPGKILKPIFDLVWNACGYPQSVNFDSDGNWIARL